MNGMKEKSIKLFLNEIKTAMETNRKQQLVSITKKVAEIKPLSFFSAAEAITTHRNYWTSTIDEFTLVGTGKVHEIVVEKNEYEHLNDSWESLKADTIIHNPYEVQGTGLVALGGMSFDPLKKKTSLWDNFADTQLYIPEFLLTKEKDCFYLTINTYLSPEDDVSEIVTKLNEKETILMMSEAECETNINIESNHEVAPKEWKETIAKAIHKIKTSNIEKIVMARELQLKLYDSVDISSVIARLLETQTDSYIFAFDHDGDCFIGASPERLVKLEKNELLSTCLAGTAPRGETEAKDKQLSYEFLHDEKNLGEHDFVVQMIHKSIEEYCHNINIPSKPVIHKLKNLQHLYTPVRATLNNSVTIFDIIEQLHPTPALGGTPTDEALEFIREYEILDRGWYGAPVGWLDNRNYGEFIVAIRSGLISNDKASLFAGCGIVADSDIEDEYQETNMKFLPMLNAIER